LQIHTIVIVDNYVRFYNQCIIFPQHWWMWQMNTSMNMSLCFSQNTFKDFAWSNDHTIIMGLRWV
jgi:hypothetical protein